MRKFISVILAFLILCPQVLAGNLYFLRNTNKTVVQPLIEDAFARKNYYINKKDPYHAYEIGNPSNYVTIVLYPMGGGLYCYYSQPSNKNDVDKVLQRNWKRAGILYEQSYNTSYIQTFESQAAQVLAPVEKEKYSFNENEYYKTPKQEEVTVNYSNVLKGYVGEVAAGTSFSVYLNTPINTSTAQEGDQINAVLTQNWVYRNNVIAPQGSVVTGYISKARAATYGSRNGRVVMKFNTITTPEGKVFNIQAEDIDFTVTNDGKMTSVAGSVAGGAIAGLLAGLLFAAMGSNIDVGPAIAIGAGSGAALGAAKAGIEQGVDAEIPVYTELEIVLERPMSVVLNY